MTATKARPPYSQSGGMLRKSIEQKLPMPSTAAAAPSNQDTWVENALVNSVLSKPASTQTAAMRATFATPAEPMKNATRAASGQLAKDCFHHGSAARASIAARTRDSSECGARRAGSARSVWWMNFSRSSGECFMAGQAESVSWRAPLRAMIAARAVRARRMSVFTLASDTPSFLAMSS